MQPPMPPPPAPAPVAWQTPPELSGPAPGVRFAGHGARFIAYVVDGLILGVAFVVLTFVFAAVETGAAASDSIGAAVGGGLLYVLAILLVSIIYFPWFWARGGQTPGMRMLRIRVVRDSDGGPVSGGTAILRLLGFWVSSAVFWLGFIWILVDKRRRGWHDLIAGTCVIEVP